MRTSTVVAWFALPFAAVLAATSLSVIPNADAQQTAVVNKVAPVRVFDGDSLEVAGKTYRLYGIAAPTRDQTCTVEGKQWPCGALARDALSGLVMGKAVDCTPVGQDSEGAATARCTAGGRDLATYQVKFGWALADRRESTDYVAMETEANSIGTGMWRGDFAMPWEVMPPFRCVCKPIR